MKQLIFTFLTYFALSNASYSQDIVTDNHQLYGGLGIDIFKDVLTYTENEETFILAVGRSTIDSELNEFYQGGTNDLVIAKFDASNNLIWSRNFGGSDIDVGNCAVRSSDGGFIVAGSTRSSDGDVSDNAAQFTQDVWVLKIDPSGELVWEQTYGGVLEEVALDIVVTSDGNYVLASAAQSASGDNTVSQGGYDFWLTKINESGEVLWQEIYGGSDTDNPESLIETSDGSIVSAGWTRSNNSGDVSENYGLHDFWVVKTDALGQMLWERNFGGSEWDRAYEVAEDQEGNYYVFGKTESADNDVSTSYGSSDMWLIKINEEGELIWEKSFGGSGIDEGYDFAFYGENAAMILCGLTDSNDQDFSQGLGGFDAAQILISSEGEVISSLTSGGSEEDIAYAQTRLSDSQLIAVGSTRSEDVDLVGFEAFGNRDNWIFTLSLTTLSAFGSESDLGINVYPNPSDGIFQVEVPSGVEHLQILTFEGKTLEELDLDIGKSMLKLTEPESGIYLLKFSGSRGYEIRRLMVH